MTHKFNLRKRPQKPTDTVPKKRRANNDTKSPNTKTSRNQEESVEGELDEKWVAAQNKAANKHPKTKQEKKGKGKRSAKTQEQNQATKGEVEQTREEKIDSVLRAFDKYEDRLTAIENSAKPVTINFETTGDSGPLGDIEQGDTTARINNQQN